jgi:hypothetical protein
VRADRLEVVVRVRQLFEQRRLAERAVAERAVVDACRERAAVERALAGSGPSVGPTDVERLRHGRGEGLALQEAAERAASVEDAARARLADAEQRRTSAAVERRSAERLQDRRVFEAAIRAARSTDRQLDAAALETWRRRR